MENAIDTSCHDVTKNKWHELWPCTRIAELLDTAATAPPPCVSSQTRVTRSSVFDRLSMLDFACFMDLNIANWVKSTRASDPQCGVNGVESSWEEIEQLLGSDRSWREILRVSVRIPDISKITTNTLPVVTEYVRGYVRKKK